MVLLLGMSCATSAMLKAQGTFTPMPLDSGFGPLDTSAPSVPPDQIITQFSAKETEYKAALGQYTYQRIAKIDTIDDDTHKITGEWYEVDDVTFRPDGGRMEKVVDAPPSTLDQGGLMMSPTDLQDIEHGYPFVLTTEDVPKYNITYVGREKVDALNCYVFDVTPKKIEKNQRYLDGRIWVDAKDLQIVVTDGHMVPDDTKRGQEDLHPPFMTWRQQIDGHYWFPVYTKGEGILHFTGGYGSMDQDVHIREVVKYANYKRFGSSSTIIYDGQNISNDGSQPGGPPPQNGTPQQK